MAATLVVEAIFFAALSPLLPGLAEDLSLSKWQSGLLVSAYGLAVGAFAIPAGMIASRLGVRQTVVLGLLLLAVASVLFGVVHGYWPLVIARFGQGVGGTLIWTGGLAWLIAASPSERRGELLGSAMSAAIVGALLGPILGGFASHFGPSTAFSAVAAIAAGLALLVPFLPSPPQARPQPARVLVRALRRRDVQLSLWMLLLPALLFGTLSVLGPLQLDRVGYGVIGVAATFVCSGIAEASVSPLGGRWSDRIGPLPPLRAGLAGVTAVSLVIAWIDERWLLAAVIVLFGAAVGLLWTPSMATLSHGWEAAGVEHGLGFALLNLAFAFGHVIGSAAGGALAGAASDQVAWGVLAALCLATFPALRLRPAGVSRLAARAADP